MTELSPQFRNYAAAAQEDVNMILERPTGTDQSAGSRCDVLTRSFQLRAKANGILLRRELHRNEDGEWHYLIVHDDPESSPTEEDVITDLNPWQFSRGRIQEGPLHGPRHEVIDMLRTRGAWDRVLALRGLSTIVMPHDDNPNYNKNRGTLIR